MGRSDPAKASTGWADPEAFDGPPPGSRAPDFAAAYFRIWLGDDPMGVSMRDALPGR
jgi:hypothetical protein